MTPMEELQAKLAEFLANVEALRVKLEATE